MDVKNAVNVARRYVTDIFSDENFVNMGLEEVEYDDNDKLWNVTLGLTRKGPSEERAYKVVRIKDNQYRGDYSDMELVVSVKNR